MSWEKFLTMSQDEQAAYIASLDKGTLIVVLVVALVVLIVLVVPPFWVLFTKRTSGATKTLWFVITGCFSWLAWPFYLKATRRKSDASGGRPPA
jgi:hypothetical protein